MHLDPDLCTTTVLIVGWKRCQIQLRKLNRQGKKMHSPEMYSSRIPCWLNTRKTLAYEFGVSLTDELVLIRISNPVVGLL